MHLLLLLLLLFACYGAAGGCNSAPDTDHCAAQPITHAKPCAAAQPIPFPTATKVKEEQVTQAS
jgi:hypothetical protein